MNKLLVLINLVLVVVEKENGVTLHSIETNNLSYLLILINYKY